MGRVIAWDAENRPLTITLSGITTTFAYDGDGRRVKKAETNGITTTTTVYVGNHYELKTYSTNSDLPWWNARWGQREVLTVTNQLASTLAAGYTLKVYLTGSQSSNIYGKSLASGNDLRVAYWDGKAWKELDRDLVAFSSSAIELRFKTQADISSSGLDNKYYLYYGNFTAGTPPSDGKKVYYYFNDFSINAVDWTATAGTWAQSVITGADGKLGWTYRQSVDNNGSTNTYQKTLNLTDFVYEVKARIATPASGGHAATASWRYVDGTHYEAFGYGTFGFTGLWKYDGSFSWLDTSPAVTYTLNTWYTFVITTSGTSQATKVGSDLWTATDSSRVTGTIGLRTYNADVYYDDVKVWKLVSANPTVALGAEATRPVADKYYYGGSQRIAMRSGGTLTYIFSDHLGGTSVTLNATTGLTSTISYYPYGGSRFSTGALPTDRLYTGQVSDSSTGLYDYGARSYDAAVLARFISPDSVVPSFSNPQSLNRYAYALGNPLKYVDPSGHFVLLVGGVKTGNDNEQNLEDWKVMMEQLHLDPTHETGEDWAFFDWGDEPAASSGGASMEAGASRLSKQIAGKENIKIIGHSRGGAVAIEYAAEVAEEKLDANGELKGIYSIDGAIWPGNSVFDNPIADERYKWDGLTLVDRYADLPARLKARSLSVDVATFDNKADWPATTHDPLPGASYSYDGNDTKGKQSWFAPINWNNAHGLYMGDTDLCKGSIIYSRAYLGDR